MNRESLYNKTVQILFDAYFNDTLTHTDPCGCAIGNLVAARTNVKGQQDWGWAWWNAMISYKNDSTPNLQGCLLLGHIQYSWPEIIKIEHAFESEVSAIFAENKHNSTFDYDAIIENEDYKFRGLVRVLEALAEIHGISDNTPDLNKFRAHYNTLTPVN